MTPTGNQRWSERRASYRPAGEVIDPLGYDVAPVDEGTAKAFVLAHHYSGTYPAARFRFGLYRHGALVGVAVFSHPCSDSVLTRVFPLHPATDAVELGRFVLLDDVPGNGETWFLARCFEQLRQRVVGVVSFSDPVARPDAHGRVVFPGHLGTIYQAHNGVFLGRGKARVLRLLPNGQVFSERAISKIRRLERGWSHCVAALEAAGARPFDAAGDVADAQAWLSVELARVTRPLRHPGNLKYAWALARRVRRELPAGQPYPKRAVEERRAA
jgi:hypothetical protein